MAEDVSLQKRAQIAKASKTMFIWVAIASLLVGAAAVTCYFMVKVLFYGEAVLAAKQETESNLTHNLSVVDELKSQIRALDANDALASVKASANDQALQVVLDALPSEANSLALGASLQNKLLIGDGIKLESIQVDPVVGVETGLESGEVVDATATDSDTPANAIGFRFTLSGPDLALRTVLSNLERSIRVMDITAVRISGETGGQTMVVEGRAYYEPAKKIELQDKVVPRE